MNKKQCVICGGYIVGYGNNAETLTKGECCDECNQNKVRPARVELAIMCGKKSVSYTIEERELTQKDYVTVRAKYL